MRPGTQQLYRYFLSIFFGRARASTALLGALFVGCEPDASTAVPGCVSGPSCDPGDMDAGGADGASDAPQDVAVTDDASSDAAACGACAPLSERASFLGVTPCCTERSACGAFFIDRCEPLAQPGASSSTCPAEQIGGFRASGCCRDDGRCGVDLGGLDMGCVAREDAPGGALSGLTCGQTLPAPNDYVSFESDQVRPLALSADGKRLFATNTPDARLEIFAVEASGLVLRESVPVGLEPVAVAVRNEREVWVVNHLSDSISIVDVGSVPARVVRTLWVGDEPRDIVFAGRNYLRAFVTTAHRGQNHPLDPALLTPGVGRADVWVFAADRLGPEPGGAPMAIVNLFGDTPRALAVTPDGETVYAAVYHSGNRTTTLSQSVAANQLPPPTANVEGTPQPSVGLIVRFDGQNWVDETKRAWNDRVRFSLPDYDVFAIDALAEQPTVSRRYAGVGTTLFNMAVNPQTSVVYVSNTEAHNERRFEPTLRGQATETRVTVLRGNTITPRDLNPHIERAIPEGSAGERSLSLALPTAMAVSADGKTLFVAALGSSKVSAIAASALEDGSFAPRAADQVTVSGGGPTGLVLAPNGQTLYVLTRYDNGISSVDVGTRREVAHVQMPNPEPPEVREGRPFLYDATEVSAHGDQACASCHIFGDTDHLAWDLGDPGGQVTPDRNPGGGTRFHPMKGPMVTQSLRGLEHAGPLHWRGDRSGAVIDGSSFSDTIEAFHQFNGAFMSLLGRDRRLTRAEMQRFALFTMRLTYPPNPIRKLDGSLTAEQAEARRTYFNDITDIIDTCNGCHTLDPAQGFFGTSGRSANDAEPQIFKIPHLRNAYDKVGMFGMSGGLGIPGTGFMGDQIRGFGYTHDGSVDTLTDFLSARVFSLTGEQKKKMAEFVLAYDSNLAPSVGQQVTISPSSRQLAQPRLSLLVQQARLGAERKVCELIAFGVIDGRTRGFLLRAEGTFQSDKAAEPPWPAEQLFSKAEVAAAPLTFTCVPPGTGRRAALDRDRDGVLNGDDH